jgi:hypothetical protein
LFLRTGTCAVPGRFVPWLPRAHLVPRARIGAPALVAQVVRAVLAVVAPRVPEGGARAVPPARPARPAGVRRRNGAVAPRRAGRRRRAVVRVDRRAAGPRAGPRAVPPVVERGPVPRAKGARAQLVVARPGAVRPGEPVVPASVGADPRIEGEMTIGAGALGPRRGKVGALERVDSRGVVPGRRDGRAALLVLVIGWARTSRP